MISNLFVQPSCLVLVVYILTLITIHHNSAPLARRITGDSSLNEWLACRLSPVIWSAPERALTCDSPSRPSHCQSAGQDDLRSKRQSLQSSPPVCASNRPNRVLFVEQLTVLPVRSTKNSRKSDSARNSVFQCT